MKLEIFNAQNGFTRMTSNVGLTFSVGDSIPGFSISIKQDNQNWWESIQYVVQNQSASLQIMQHFT